MWQKSARTSTNMEWEEVKKLSVNAKFKVARVTPGIFGPDNTEVEFVPDYAQGRNADWAKATPAGVIRLTVSNQAALEKFTMGRAFTVTFEPEDE